MAAPATLPCPRGSDNPFTPRTPVQAQDALLRFPAQPFLDLRLGRRHNLPSGPPDRSPGLCIRFESQLFGEALAKPRQRLRRLKGETVALQFSRGRIPAPVLVQVLVEDLGLVVADLAAAFSSH